MSRIKVIAALGMSTMIWAAAIFGLYSAARSYLPRATPMPPAITLPKQEPLPMPNFGPTMPIIVPAPAAAPPAPAAPVIKQKAPPATKPRPAQREVARVKATGQPAKRVIKRGTESEQQTFFGQTFFGGKPLVWPGDRAAGQ